MYVIYGQFTLFLPQSSSLKDKRQTIQSIMTRLHKRFNISVCEVNYQNLWQRSALGFAAAANSSGEADFILQSIKNTLEYYEDVCEITDFANELVSF